MGEAALSIRGPLQKSTDPAVVQKACRTFCPTGSSTDAEEYAWYERNSACSPANMVKSYLCVMSEETTKSF